MLKRDILLTISYWSLNGYPLTFVELVKFLSHPKTPRLFNLQKALNELALEKKIEAWRGFYFLPKKRNQVKQRINNQKLAIAKRKKFKKILKEIRFIPYLQAIFLSGSFNIDNSKKNSDFDFLVITKKNRLWLCRFLLSFYVLARGWKRVDQKTSNKVCLNCFLAQDNLAITNRNKPHDLHSAQEYNRLIPVLEEESYIFRDFKKKNLWIKKFIGRHPWPSQTNSLKIKYPKWVTGIKRGIERIIELLGANFWERVLGSLQKKRIHAQGPQDQIYCSDQCLMLHPSSKAFKILKELELIKK